MSDQIYKVFESRIDELIRAKNRDLIAILKELPFAALGDPLYREKEGYRNALVYTKQILREVLEADKSGTVQHTLQE